MPLCFAECSNIVSGKSVRLALSYTSFSAHSKMAKSGKKARAGKGTSTKNAGLKFSAGAIGGRLKRGRFAKRVSKAGAVYLAAAIEYCTSELLELATKVASKDKKSTLKPRHNALAVRNDDELNKLLATVTIVSGGVVPNVHPAIAKKK